MIPRMRRWIWVLFLALGFLWGSSYLWIKIGLESLPPLTLIGARLAIGGLFLATVVGVLREPLPRSARMYGHLLVMAVVNIVIPFVLIAFGEQSIDSALASILNATVPLAVIVIAPFFLPDERITPARVAGLAVGFAGRRAAGRARPREPRRRGPDGRDAAARSRASRTRSATSTRGATSTACRR